MASTHPWKVGLKVGNTATAAAAYGSALVVVTIVAKSDVQMYTSRFIHSAKVERSALVDKKLSLFTHHLRCFVTYVILVHCTTLFHCSLVI